MENAKELYAYFGILIGVPAFLATWWFCIAEFGLLIGILVGWLIGLIVGLIGAFAWPFLLTISLAHIPDGGSGEWVSRLLHLIGSFEAVTVGFLIIATIYSVLTEVAIKVENWSRGKSKRQAVVVSTFPILVSVLFVASRL